MQLFTPIEYMQIEIANLHGIDKCNYADRLEWFNTLFDPADIPRCESPNQARVAYQEYQRILRGLPSNYCISLDATASVLQVIAVIMNCRKTAQQSNVIGHTRNDPYTLIHMATGLTGVSRKDCKRAIMTISYGSQKIPKEVYGDNIDTFLNAMVQEVPSAVNYLELTQSLWNSGKTHHYWTLPDNFNVVLPSMVTAKETVYVLGEPITIEYEVLGTKKHSKELSANVIHS